MASDLSKVDQERLAAQRASARKRQAEFRARQRARGLEMITLKVPAPMRGAFTRLAARLQSPETSEEALDEVFSEIREAYEAWSSRAAGEAPTAVQETASAPIPAPAPAPAAPPEDAGPAPFEEWVDLAGLWSSSAIVGSLFDFSVVLADLGGEVYARWTARQRRTTGIATVDAYVRGSRSGPHDAVITTGRMTLGGRDLQFRAVVTGPARLDATLTEYAADGSATVHQAVFTRSA